MRVRHTISLFLIAAVVAACAAIGPRAAEAQELSEPRQRQGYYVSGGLHAAIAYDRDEGEGLGPWGGTAFTIRVGQLLTRRLGLGLQIDTGATSGEGRTSSLVGIGVDGQVELARNLAFHAGIGLGIVNLDDPARDEIRGGYGAAYTLGLTYDWFLGNRRSGGFALTPGIRLRALPSDTVDAFAAMAGIEISYWSGLPKNQLVLPDKDAYSSN